MTAPTQPPDPRVQRIADALDVWSDTVGYESHRRLARVLVEELGGREENEPVEKADPRIAGWMEVCTEIFKLFPTMHTDMRQIPVHSRQAAAIRQLAAQQRENADTIKALRERAEVAERATAELDAQRKSAEQSARDLRENNATLRAELDAIKGAQRGVKFIAHNDVECTARFADGKYNITWQHGELGPMTLDAMYKTWSHLKAEERAALEALRHPAPALPVVGACLVRGKEITVVTQQYNSQAACEDIAVTMATRYNGTAHQLLLGAPLTTEGGK